MSCSGTIKGKQNKAVLAQMIFNHLYNVFLLQPTASAAGITGHAVGVNVTAMGLDSRTCFPALFPLAYLFSPFHLFVYVCVYVLVCVCVCILILAQNTHFTSKGDILVGPHIFKDPFEG